jgi:outer membrane protein insertion porin family
LVAQLSRITDLNPTPRHSMHRTLLNLFVFAGLVLCASDLAAQPGMGYEIEEIEIRGNRKTNPEIILRAMPLHRGDLLTPGRVAATQDALYRTRLFRTVHVASRPGSGDGKAVLVVYVEEKRFGDIGASFEYTELDGFGIAADAYHVNLWGEGKWVGAELRRGERLSAWGLSYTDPWFSRSRLSLHVRGGYSATDRDLYRSKDEQQRGSYDLNRTGGSVGIGWPLGLAHRAILSYGIADVEVAGYQAPAVPTFGGEYAAEVAGTLGRDPFSYFGLELQRIPSGRPSGSYQGTEFSLRLDYSAGFLGSDDDFIRTRVEAFRHIETLPGHFLTVGGRAGTIFGSPPFYERFYLDGPNQLRGFEQREIGPEGGMRFVSSELRYCIPLGPIGRVYGFGEWAYVTRPVAGDDRSDSGGSFGLGVLLFNRVDISFGLNTETFIVKSHRFGGINVGL